MGGNVELFTDEEWNQLTGWFALTPRQGQIARLMCDGHTYKSIAHATDISVNTVRMHIRALYAKLNVHDRVSVLNHLITAKRSSAGPTGLPVGKDLYSVPEVRLARPR